MPEKIVDPVIRKWVDLRFGIEIDERRHGEIVKLLSRIRGLPGDPLKALEQIASRNSSLLLKVLTNHESRFFRGDWFFERLSGWFRTGQVKTLLSAGCSRGQELYSCAMTACSTIGRDRAEHIRMYGVDIDSEAVGWARRGVYEPRALKNIDQMQKALYFLPVTNEEGAEVKGCRRSGEPGLRAGEHLYSGPECVGMRVAPFLRRMVSFQTVNIVEPWPQAWFYAFDLVLLRNVLVHFTERARADLARRLCMIVRPGGILVLAATEVTGFQPDGFRIKEEDGFFYFERSAWSDRSFYGKYCHRPGGEEERPRALHARQAKLMRKSVIAETESTVAAGAATNGDDGACTPLPGCFRLFEHGRFDEALEECEKYLDKAEGRISSEDEGALRALSAIIHMEKGEKDKAVELIKRAAFLLPVSWVVHFHHGRLLEERGEPKGARRAFRRALACLETGKVQVQLDELFLGGFPSDRMIKVCESAISRCRNGRR